LGGGLSLERDTVGREFETVGVFDRFSGSCGWKGGNGGGWGLSALKKIIEWTMGESTTSLNRFWPEKDESHISGDKLP